MIFDKPVFAFACSAVPETLGKAGVLIEYKSPKNIAKTINQVLNDPAKLAELQAGRQQRLQDLSYGKLLEQFRQDIQEIIALKAELQ